MTLQKVTPEPCAECGRMLRSKKSIDQQRGPACQKKYLKRLKDAGQLDGGSSGKSSQLQARSVEVYLVTDVHLISKITKVPRSLCESVEVQVYTELITYRWPKEQTRHKVVDVEQDADRFRRIKMLLREATEGVKRITDQMEVPA